MVEPYLIQLALLERTPKGRIATQKAYDHLNFTFRDKKQKELL